MVRLQEFVPIALLASFASVSVADPHFRSPYDQSFHRRDTALQTRGELADILDKNPNIKSLIAPYSDIVDGLIKRDEYGLRTRDAAELETRERRRLAFRDLRLRQLIRRVAEANAESEAEAEAESDADADADAYADPDAKIELDEIHIREAAALPYAESEAEASEEVEMDRRNIMTTVFQGNVDSAKNSKREADPESEVEVLDEMFTRDAAPDPNIMTTVFQGNVESAQKNSKRSLKPAPVYEATSSIFARMYKSGGELLSGLANSFKRKRDAEAVSEDPDLFERS